MAVASAVRDLGAEAVSVDEIYNVNADVFAPCALGAVLQDETIPKLKVSVIAGSANNQLATADHGKLIQDRGILYAPDYAINAGGIINIAFEDRATGTYDRVGALAAVGRIEATLEEIFTRADIDGRATNEIADEMAEERLAQATE
jgi:leucine dehydrogenase